ncbi:MAG TPA: LysM peptidoglycan-binding domain-containing protein [Anaerolineales bacterium]|nr:LysM peptidoglycan-binding domain-containing protein [Anaerolineales bacterium]
MKRTFAILLTAALILSMIPMTPAVAQSGCTSYTVQPGDNLFRIGLKFNTTAAAIQTANGLASPIIRVGQVLCIPTGGAVTPTKPGPTAIATSSTIPGTYTVQAGDNLFRIAIKFNTTIAAIQQLNGLTSAIIRVGQVLKIPGGGGAPAPTAVLGATATKPPTTGGGSIPGTYTVQSGDNLYRIAIKFNTTVAAIQQLNGLTSAIIRVGQVLKIPGGASAPAPTTKPPSTSAPGATPTKVPTAIPSTSGGGFEVGGQVGGFSRPDLMQHAGMTWVKRQVRWAPESRASDFFNVITDAHNKGFKVLLSVLGDPGHATSANFPSYATFVGELAGAGADGIEVWNEMNIDREWPKGSISASNYVPMLQQAYNAIKAKNANTLVVSGAPAPTGFFGGCTGNGCDDKPYIEGLVAAGGLSYLDCIGIHYNEGVVPPTQSSGDPRGNPNHYTRYYQTMVDTYYNAGGGKKKLCFTELGYLSGQEWGTLPGAYLWKPPYNLTVAEQAQFLADAVRLSRDQGKTRLLIVFNVDLTLVEPDPQAGYAMIRPGGSCPACDSIRGVTGGR